MTSHNYQRCGKWCWLEVAMDENVFDIYFFRVLSHFSMDQRPHTSISHELDPKTNSQEGLQPSGTPIFWNKASGHHSSEYGQITYAKQLPHIASLCSLGCFNMFMVTQYIWLMIYFQQQQRHVLEILALGQPIFIESSVVHSN